MPLVLITEPARPLVALAELQAFCRVDVDADGTSDMDTQLTALERAAHDYLDGYSGRLGRCILDQKWGMKIAPDKIIGGSACLGLPFPDTNAHAIEVLTGSDYRVEAGPGIEIDGAYAILSDLPDQDNLYLTFQSGWDGAENVPNNIKQAVRLLVLHWLDRPHDEVPPSIPMLIGPYLQTFGHL